MGNMWGKYYLFIIFDCSKCCIMASIRFLLKGNSNPSTIYVRFKHGRKHDFTKTTSLIVNPKYWNSSKGIIKQISEFEDKVNLQNKLNSLYSLILNRFNDSYASGIIINSDWLETLIKNYFEQNDETDFNYFTDYAEYYRVNLNSKVLKNGNTGVKEGTIKKCKTIINKVSDFETHIKKRIKLIDINAKFHKDFIHFLHNTQLLNFNTIGKYLLFVKTICLDAKKYGLKVSPDLENGEFRQTKEKVLFITLNENEIQKIFEHDFSNKEFLDNARNWLIIGVWTGARVSDLLKLTMSNITGDFIEYTAKKTAQKIILPLHPQVKFILNELNGEFPREISSQKFNDYIKIVCENVGINEMILGSKKTKIKKKVWRQETGMFKKSLLVSTHICRRSFATNHYGKLPTPVIMTVTGHTTEKMFLSYIGKTAKDNADILNEFWKLQELKREKKTTLKIVKTG